MTLTYQGRLPGVDCIATLPTEPQPIRLDVPGFVGLAAQGPLDQPTPIEDYNQYLAVFGGDLVLAQNDGVPVYANLPATVKSFFDNGGLRCYVVRVAGPNAVAARWLVPGVRSWWPNGTVEEVFVGASWPGAWSTGVEVGTQLLAQPLAVTGAYQPATPAAAGSLPLAAPSALALVPGDLIALDFGPAAPGVYITVASLSSTGWTVTAGIEVPQSLGPAVPLAGPLPVASAMLLRFDIVVEQRPGAGGSDQLVEQWLDLTFNPPGGATGPTWWLDVTQQGGTPNLSLSMFLRADPEALASTGTFVPLAMDALGTTAEFVDATVGSLPNPGVVAGDDDLATFDPVALFLDPHLLDESVYDLIDDANSYTVLSSDPITLTGIHSLIDVDEVAMISVPDASQLGWSEIVPVPVAPPPPVPPPVPAPINWSSFRNCAVAPPPAPPAAPPPPTPPTPLPYPVENDPASYDPSGLTSVQVALVQLCAARADAVAVLSLPAHYSTVDFLSWSQQMTNDGRISGSPLSFAAAWHPWVQLVEPTTPQLAPLRPLPPDGPATGTIAAHENARGVWVAPANIALRGVVDLTPTLVETDEVSLFNAHDNILVHDPGAFVALSAHTLSPDPSLLQLSVRRLLILLRKICLERGMRYVFETNTDRFRQMVQRSFTRLLSALTQAGAIVNFSVVTAGGVNTAEDIAAGRFIVQLLIAPTNPIEFITVTLVRAGEGLLDVLEGWS